MSQYIKLFVRNELELVNFKELFKHGDNTLPSIISCPKAEDINNTSTDDVLHLMRIYNQREGGRQLRLELYDNGSGMLYETEQGLEILDFAYLIEAKEYLEEELSKRPEKWIYLEDRQTGETEIWEDRNGQQYEVEIDIRRYFLTAKKISDGQ